MDFESRLRKYLGDLSAGSGVPASAPLPLRHIGAADLYAHHLDQLRRIESGESRWLIERIYREWSLERVERFARYLETVPSPLASTHGQASREFPARVLDQAIGWDDPDLGIVDRLELQRIAHAFESGDMQQYAHENRLAVAEPQQGDRVTKLGHAFLRLRGRDAIQWLLTVEVSQSTGSRDPWRTPRQLLEDALNGIDIFFADGRRRHVPYAWETLDRLDDLTVLGAQVTDAYHERRYFVRDAMVELVRAVLDAGPWHAAVTALLEDERAPVVHGREAATATQATDQLTKLIAHEVRNALVPVRHHFDALRAASSEVSVIERIDKARRGVVRVLEFVDELVATSDLIGEPATSCNVAEVIHEAISWTDAGERVETVTGAQVRVRAPRSPLVRAISNIVLNALQATSPGGRVQVAYRTNRDMVEIVIDDGGSGVPVELRSKIFDDGYTTRGGPGHGFGLAFVRSVVEGRLRGRYGVKRAA